MKNFLLISFAIPDEEIKKTYSEDRSPQVQTHKFVWNLIKGLTLSTDSVFTYISARPVSDYPFYTKKFIKKEEWSVEISSKQISILEIPFINTSILKIITRFFSGLFYSISRYHKKQPKNGIIVYSVHVPFMLIGFILSRIYGVELIGIWTDPPSVITTREPRLKRCLRSVELIISKWLMRRFTKVVVLTKYLAENFAPGKPYLVVEGIIDEKEITNPPVFSRKNTNPGNSVKIVYTGTLKKEYGIKNIIEGFLLTGDERLSLFIYGAGDYEEEIIRLSGEKRNIHFMGWVPNDVALQAQRDADFLINARSPEDEYVKYSFPSKTLEYMLSGTPLITSLLPGMPEEYADYFIPLLDNEPQTICEALQRAVLLNEKQRKQLGRKAMQLAKTKNYQNQGSKIVDFLEKI